MQVRAGVQQCLHDSRVRVSSCCEVKRGPAAGASVMKVSTGLDEGLDHLGIGIGRSRLQQRHLSPVPTYVHIRSGPQKQADRRGIAGTGRGVVEWCQAALVTRVPRRSRVDVCSRIHQGGGDRGVLVPSRFVQRGVVPPVVDVESGCPSTHIRARLQEPGEDRQIRIVPGGKVQGSIVTFVARVRIGPGFQQYGDHPGVAGPLGRQVQATRGRCRGSRWQTSDGTVRTLTSAPSRMQMATMAAVAARKKGGRVPSVTVCSIVWHSRSRLEPPNLPTTFDGTVERTLRSRFRRAATCSGVRPVVISRVHRSPRVDEERDQGGRTPPCMVQRCAARSNRARAHPRQLAEALPPCRASSGLQHHGGGVVPRSDRAFTSAPASASIPMSLVAKWLVRTGGIHEVV